MSGAVTGSAASSMNTDMQPELPGPNFGMHTMRSVALAEQ
jgi:hypothetical protein